MGKQYNDIQIKNMLELSVDVCNINILIGSGFSMPTFPNMEQVQTLIKLLLQYFLDSNILNTLEDTDDLKKLNNFLEVNKINELFLNLKEKINYSNWDSKKINELIVSLEDKNMNFENLLYKDHLNNYLNNDKDKTGIREYNLSFLFVNLFFELYLILRNDLKYKKNIEKFKSLFVWILNKHLLNSKRSLKNTINVFTTNYDTFIEEALENLKQFYYNGFHGTINKTFSPEYYNYKYFDDMNLNKNFYQEKKSLFNLYKLHGSITWNYNEEKEKLEEIGIQSSINFLKRSNYPHIIYPSTEKYSMSLNYEHYYELQTKFKECLNKKDSCLLVIGFSLKDNHIWKVINEALSNGNLIVFIFSSDNILDENNMILEEKVKEKFRDNLLNINGINFVCFENYNYEEYFMKSANYEFEQGFENKTNIINVKNEVIDND